MAKEIERKFLVKDDTFAALAQRTVAITQAYLSVGAKSVVRVRITRLQVVGDPCQPVERAFITVKSKTVGCERDEWEYEIPVSDARQMLACAVSAVISKVRYIVPFRGMVWEVDVFDSPHHGLVVAEIELPSAEAPFDLPSFIGEEVTGNPLYYNSTLAALKKD